MPWIFGAILLMHAAPQGALAAAGQKIIGRGTPSAEWFSASHQRASDAVESAAPAAGVPGGRRFMDQKAAVGETRHDQLPGDVNGDGVVDAGDVACAVASVFGTAGCAVAPIWAGVPETGQVTCYAADGTIVSCDGTGQDGDLRPGGAWPTPRFTDTGDGTVADNLTGLVWLRDASCADLEGTDSNGRGDWTTALAAAGALADGTCGLMDGSESGDWRLPSRFELESLLDLEYSSPPLSNAAGTGQWSSEDAFVGVLTSSYWSATSDAYYPHLAFGVILSRGGITTYQKADTSLVWPVRGGQ